MSLSKECRGGSERLKKSYFVVPEKLDILLDLADPVKETDRSYHLILTYKQIIHKCTSRLYSFIELLVARKPQKYSIFIRTVSF